MAHTFATRTSRQIQIACNVHIDLAASSRSHWKLTKSSTVYTTSPTFRQHQDTAKLDWVLATRFVYQGRRVAQKRYERRVGWHVNGVKRDRRSTWKGRGLYPFSPSLNTDWRQCLTANVGIYKKSDEGCSIIAQTEIRIAKSFAR